MWGIERTPVTTPRNESVRGPGNGGGMHAPQSTRGSSLTLGAWGHVSVPVSRWRSDLTGGENEKLVNAAGRV